MHTYPFVPSVIKTTEITSANTNLTAVSAGQVAKMVMFVAPSTNASPMEIVAGSSITTGIKLAPGVSSGWIPCSDLTQFSYKAGTTGDKLGWLIAY